MRAAVIKDGVVTNVIEVKSIEDFQDKVDGQLVLSEKADIENVYDGIEFIKPEKLKPEEIKPEIK